MVSVLPAAARPAAVAVAAAPAPSVTVRMHALSASDVSSLFGSGFSRSTVVWSAQIDNGTPDAITVSEASIIGRPEEAAIGFVPFAVESAVIAARQSQTILGRAEAAANDADRAALILLAARVISTSGVALTSVTLGGAILPILFRDIAGYGAQPQAALALMAFPNPLQVQAGAMVTVYCYSHNRAADFGFTLVVGPMVQSRVAR